ncbi:MAG: putative replication initiation protein [Microviridae sp.]|nr:MAG: putative replication initiation protein [Microviridae sp.]
MKCLYPITMRNPHYKPNKTNEGFPPTAWDERLEYIQVPCGNCEPCRKKKANEYRIKLIEKLKSKQGKMFTMKFSEEAIDSLEADLMKKNLPYDANAVAKLAWRRFSDRFKKKYGHRPDHWMVPELGQNNTERLHLHGLIFEQVLNTMKADKLKKEIEQLWKYGFVDIGYKCDEQTINYIVKYVSKQDEKHPYFRGEVISTPGHGKTYLKRFDAQQNRFKGNKGDETVQTYRTIKGLKLALPQYLRRKIWTGYEREQLRILSEDKQEIYIQGHKYDLTIPGMSEAAMTDLEWYRQENIRKGYGTNDPKYKKQPYSARGGRIMNNPNNKRNDKRA